MDPTAAAVAWHDKRCKVISRKLEEAKKAVAALESELSTARELGEEARDFALRGEEDYFAEPLVLTPATMNELPDDAISVRIRRMVRRGTVVPSGLAPAAPFITMDMLRRVHNMLAGIPLEERGDKNVALASVVADMTGAPMPDTEVNVLLSVKGGGGCRETIPRFTSEARQAGQHMDTTLVSNLQQLAQNRKKKRKSEAGLRLDLELKQRYYVNPQGLCVPPPPPDEPEAGPQDGVAQLAQAAAFEFGPRRSGRAAGDGGNQLELVELAWS